MRAIVEVGHVVVPIELQRDHKVRCSACGGPLSRTDHWMTYLPMGSGGKIGFKPCCSEDCANAIATAHVVRSLG